MPVPSEVVVASWNVHSGIDGWGRPFDVVAGCRAMDADVIVLQETWSPDGEVSLARRTGDALGYRVEESVIARGVMFAPPPRAGSRWGPPPWQRPFHGARVDRAPSSRTRNGATRGTLGLAVLSRLEISYVETWDLGQFLGDPTKRSAIAVKVVASGAGGSASQGLLVAGTHLSHLRHGSVMQIARLRRMLARRSGPAVPAVLGGDMNLTGAPLSVLLPGWRRTVRGPTWPAWRPLGQSDHILVTPAVEGSGEVLDIGGSDHLPVRAHLSFS